MKRVLQIINYFPPHIGGIEQVGYDISQSLKENYEQRVICFHDGTKENVTEEIDGIKVTRVGTFAKVASQSLSHGFGKALKNVMKEFKPDIVIFHYPNPFLAHYLCKYLKHKTFKFVLYWHLDITKQKFLKMFFEGQNKKLLRYADKIIATSPNYIEGSKYLSSNKEKCVVNPCCVNTSRLIIKNENRKMADEIKEKYKGKTICFGFGRHVEYKGLGYLVKASKYLDDSYKVFIGGKGPLTDELKKEAEGDSKIEFLGRLSDDELKAYLLACDIFCFPSITKNEAFGIGLAEAMFYEKPVITFTIPGSGVNYVSLKGITGEEAENRDSQEYAKAIIKLSKDPELRSQYAKNGKQRVLELFLFSEFKQNILHILKEI